MNTVRCGLLALLFVLISGLGDATGQGKKKGAGQISPLVPQPILDQLDLTAEQQKQVAKLQEEYTAQVKRMRAAKQAEMKKNKTKGAGKKLKASLVLAEDEIRRSMEPSFEKILTDAQKKKYGELKKAIPAVGKFAPKPPETVTGTIQRLDTETGALVLMVKGKGKITYRVSRATKVLDAAGKPLPDGLSDKALVPGAAVSLTLVKQDTRAQKATVLEIKLAGK